MFKSIKTFFNDIKVLLQLAKIIRTHFSNTTFEKNIENDALVINIKDNRNLIIKTEGNLLLESERTVIYSREHEIFCGPVNDFKGLSFTDLVYNGDITKLLQKFYSKERILKNSISNHTLEDLYKNINLESVLPDAIEFKNKFTIQYELIDKEKLNSLNIIQFTDEFVRPLVSFVGIFINNEKVGKNSKKFSALFSGWEMYGQFKGITKKNNFLEVDILFNGSGRIKPEILKEIIKQAIIEFISTKSLYSKLDYSSIIKDYKIFYSNEKLNESTL